ncbi:DUF3320 domain-containing protein [Asticcacaulis solisilvae]|uniref:DUF3320 domain-containing protein n=1 Tax=Asticcacaulis solisilvae TaxID=1217274 RepID=UPI003FD838F6
MADDSATTGISIRERLLKERHALLDLSTRNRLLNVPLRTRNNRVVEIVDEKAAEVFRLLSDGKAMTFLPGVDLTAEEKAALDPEDRETGGIPQPGDEKTDEKGRAARHTDSKLQTRLTSEGLQKRLFDIWYDARTFEEEQGVNILYLALGLLRWYDDDASDIARHAPLVLLPVRLERSSAADRFHLKGRDEPPSPNLTLQAKMKQEFGLVIEDFPDEDEVDLGAYASTISETVKGKKRWEVLPDAMVLGFFSFAKFLMYRDLDPDTWPAGAIEQHAMITAILRDGFPESQPLVGDDEPIDDTLPPGGQRHVVDADSSQAVAIAEVVGGRTLVVKGPPGTGKSQTITNIIAGAAAEGKKVLFVAEKMAALDVVHCRLKAVGLGPLTLELHSNKVNKRAVLEELKRTREAATPAVRVDATVPEQLDAVTGDLNGFADRLHQPLAPSGLSPQQILVRLAGWHGDGEPGGEFALDGARGWTARDVAERRAVAEDFAERRTIVGQPTQHPWRGVACDPLDPSERDAVARDIGKLQIAIAAALTEAQVATRLLAAPPPEVLHDFKRSLAWLQLTPLPRDADRLAFPHPAWTNVKALDKLIETGESLTRQRVDVLPLVNETGRDADYSAIRTAIATKSSDLFRFLDGDYKRQIALLRSYLRGILPKDPDARLKLVDKIISLQKTEAAMAGMGEQGQAFGRLWQGADSQWESLANVLNWRKSHADLPPEVWPKLAGLDDAALNDADRTRQALYTAMTEVTTLFDGLAAQLTLDLPRAFGVDEARKVVISDLDARCRAWSGDLEGLSRYIAFAARGRKLASLGAVPIVEAVHGGGLDGEDIVPAFDGAYAKVLRDVLFEAWPELKAFDGEGQARKVADFRRLDSQRIELAKQEIAVRHGEDRPKGSAGIGPLGVLNAELAKKRGHKPIRVLLEQAGAAIQDLKPVFMMSPLSVAQFLKPGALQFDLLVMDEASQIEPVDALGAIARVDQIAVVGDERQLPPTAFFKTLTGDDAPEDDDGVTIAARDAESILDLCLAKGAPHRMLSWHYRSKHQSLIAVSNREFYDNRLFIVPSPFDAVAGMGLKFHWLKDTAYDRGNTRTNPKEARIVAEAVIAHAQQNPQQSLGVATFSVSQRQAVLKELELLRRGNPDCESFFDEGRAEPFFVKNLENIQGDERDVIFISVGYGKTEQGNLAHNFGPLSGEGGERRLNVLISRAKLRCEVFANFTGADIDLERTPSRGVAALKLFMTFAETGRFETAADALSETDSLFEDQVASRLRALGYDVRTQIGASGFRVDLAIADPERPGRFVLGIECDGAQYHASRSARDRDRLRQQVLEAHGWIIHRVWSADWYLRPKEELKKLEAAIDSAKAEWRERDAHAPVPAAEAVTPLAVAEALAPPAEAGDAPERLYYAEAAFAVNRRRDPGDLSIADMADIVLPIVEQEDPVHADEVVTRVRSLWGLPRTTPKLKSLVAAALAYNQAQGVIDEDDGFWRVPDSQIHIRDRSRVTSANLRKPEMLPPAEIDAAVLKIVGDNYGAARDDLIPAVARLFGFGSTSAALRTRIEERVSALTADGQLVQKGDLLTVG